MSWLMMPALSIFPFKPCIDTHYFFLWSAIRSQNEEKVKDNMKILDQEAGEKVIATKNLRYLRMSNIQLKRHLPPLRCR